jgi:hypothetical protein
MDRKSATSVGGYARRIGAALMLLAAVAGCRSSSLELVEGELREKEKQLDDLKHESDRKDLQIQALEADIDRLQRKAAKAAGEPMGSVVLVKKITLGRSTGGYDLEPKIPGDEALQVVLEPRDIDDQSVKAPGCVHIDLYEVNPQGLEFLISDWDLSAKEVRNKWDAPLIGGPAYRIILPWKSWPNYEDMRVVVMFTTPEGQRFQADKKFTIRMPADRVKPEQLHAPKPMQPPAPAAKPAAPGVLAAPPNERTATAPPVVAPPPLEPPTTNTAVPAAYSDDGGTSPSPRARAGLKSPTAK